MLTSVFSLLFSCLINHLYNLSALYHHSLGLDDKSMTAILFGDEVDFIILFSYLQTIMLSSIRLSSYVFLVLTYS